MSRFRKGLLAATAAIGLLAAGQAGAAPKEIRIGLLTDMSGVYSDFSGRGSAVAAQLAIADFTRTHPDVRVTLLTADHQNKSDIGSAIARRWIAEDNVDALVDVPNTAVALAINELARQNNKVLLISGAGSSEMTGKQCSPNAIQWTFDTWSLAHALGESLVKSGGSSWFFLVADYAFGKTLAQDVGVEVRKDGGTVLGEVAHPLGTTDFSAYLLQAQASKAKIVALANAGTDTINAIKAAAEFGLAANGQRIAGLIVFITDIHAIGLPLSHGMQLANSFYWDLNDKTRAWSDRFAAQMGGARPSMIQAGTYSATLDYLTVAAGMDDYHDGRAVVVQMKKTPTEDDVFGRGRIRADGRQVHDMYVFEVKTPAESRGEWDLYKLVRRIPGEESVRPLGESACPILSELEASLR